jgi:hypothetical protein
MSAHLHVENPFLDQVVGLVWEVIDQGCHSIPSDPAASQRMSLRHEMAPEMVPGSR